MIRHLLPLLALLILLPPSGSTAESAADHPGAGTAPPFAEVLDAQAYARLAAPRLEAMHVPMLFASTRPHQGALIVAVAPGQQGSRLGLRPGDIITRLDGRIVPCDQAFMDRRKAGPQTVTVWSEGSGERDVALAPGRIGINSGDTWDERLAYLRSPGRDPAADLDLLLAYDAIECQPCDVRLCETALARSAKASGATWPWLRVACQLELAQGRFDDALRWGRLALAAGSDEAVRAHCAWLLYIVATRGGHLQEARDLLDAQPYAVAVNGIGEAGAQREVLDGLLASAKAFPGAGGLPLASPTLAALREPVGGFTALDAVSAPFAAALNAGSGSLPAGLLHGGRTQMVLGPACRNGVLSGAVSFPAQDPVDQSVSHQCWIALWDAQAGQGRAIATVDLAANGCVYAVPDRVASFPVPLGVPPGTATHAFRLGVVGQRLQVQVDGIDVLIAPVGMDPAQRQLGVAITMQNGGVVSELVWKIEPAAKVAVGAADF